MSIYLRPKSNPIPLGKKTKFSHQYHRWTGAGEELVQLPADVAKMFVLFVDLARETETKGLQNGT